MTKTNLRLIQNIFQGILDTLSPWIWITLVLFYHEDTRVGTGAIRALHGRAQ